MPTDRQGRLILWSAIAAYAIFFAALTIWKYRHFGYNALDLAIINNALAETLRGHWLGSSIHPPTYLADHFTPGLLLLLPVYAFAPRSETLLILQTLAVALCAGPIFLIAGYFLKEPRSKIQKSIPLVAALTWLINPFVHNLTLFEFHALPFALLPLLFAIWFYLKKRFTPFAVMLGLALLVQEDAALVVAMFGLLALVEKRSTRWWLTPLLGGGLYFVGAMKLIGSFNPNGYKFLIYYGWLGKTPGELVFNALTQPWRWIAQLLRLQNLAFGLVALLPFAFLPLLGWRYLILCTGVATQLLLGSAGGSTVVLSTHYMSLLLPGLVLAGLAGLKNWVEGREHWPEPLKLLRRQTPLAVLIALTCIIYSLFTLGPAQGVLAAVQLRSEGIRKQNEIMPLLRLIPKNAELAASYDTLAAFSSWPNVSSLNYAFLGTTQFLAKPYTLPATTDYLMIDFTDLLTYDLQYGHNPFYEEQYQRALENWPQALNNFGVVEISGTHALLRRGAPGLALVDLMPASTAGSEPLHSFDKTISLMRLNRTNEGWSAIWQLGERPALPLMLEWRHLKDHRLFTTRYLPFAYGLVPPSAWQSGKLIEVFYPDLFSDAKAGDQLGLRLFEIKSGGIDLDPLRSSFPAIDEVEWLGEPFLVSSN